MDDQFLQKAYNELIKLKKIPKITILCKNDKKLKTKVLWFFKDSEAFVPLYYSELHGSRIIDESDYLTRKNAKKLLKYIETGDFINLYQKSESKLLINNICLSLKFYEKYLLTNIYDKLINDTLIWIRNKTPENRFKFNIKFMFGINYYELEKKSIYNHLANNILCQLCISTEYRQKIINKYNNNDKYSHLVGQVCHDIICLK